MAYVDLVQPEQAQGEVQRLYQQMIASRGTVANLFMALGHSAEMLAPALALATFAGSDNSLLPARHKQLVYLAASRVNRCNYCLQRHAVAGAKAGLTAIQIAAILNPEGKLPENPAFDRREKLMITYAEELTRHTSGHPDTVEALREEVGPQIFLELTFVIATASMFNRLADGLHIELEPEFVNPE